MSQKINSIQSAFTGGEISERLLGRIDLDTYNKSTKRMRNAYPLAHGGATKRKGTGYVGQVEDSEKPVHLIPFIFSRRDRYILVFNNGRIQFVTEGAFIAGGSPPVAQYSIAHPYSDDELEELSYAQSGNLMFLAHPNHHPKILQRIADDDWTLTNASFVYNALSDHTFENAFITFRIITVGSGFPVGDKFTITVASNGTYSLSSPSSLATKGDMVSIEVNQNNIVAQSWEVECIFSTEDRQEWSVTGSVSGTPAAQWQSGDYPKAVSFYEQRFYLAGSNTYPQRIWGSAAGDFFNLTLGPEDNDGLEFTIASNRFDQIIHLESSRQLLPFAESSEFSLSGPGNTTITPAAVSVRTHTFHGTSNVKPNRIGSEILFVQRDGKKVRSQQYDIMLDTNSATDLTILAEHITRDHPLVAMAYAQDPDQITWTVRADGSFPSLTHIKDLDVTGWSIHETDGIVESVAVIPQDEGDVAYFCIAREIDGESVKYIEYLTADRYVDCSLAFESEGPVGTITGLEHLEGKQVSIYADDRVHPVRTVTDGEVELEYEASNVVVGLPYTTTIELLHPNVATPEGVSKGRKTRIAEVVLQLQDTIGIRVNQMEQAPLTFPLTLDAPLEPYTGELAIKLTGWQTPNNILIEHDLPTPCTLLAVVHKLEIND